MTLSLRRKLGMRWAFQDPRQEDTFEFLTMNERVVVEYAYRKVGRPEKRYRMALI